jgi:YVTN family beta-propeller protein
VSTLSYAGGVSVPLPRGTYLGQVASSTSARLLNVSYLTFGGTGAENGGGLVQYNPQTHQHTSMDASPFIPQSIIAAADGSSVFAIGNVTGFAPFDQVTVFSSQSGVQTVTFKGADFVAVQLSADGKTLYLVDHAGNLDLVDTTTLQMTGTVPVGIQPDAISVNADGSEAMVADEKSTSVSVIDLTTRAVRGTIPIGTPSTGVAYVN